MPQPRTYRTHALILRHRDFGEADRLITILTPQHGKLDVLAKGVRKPTSTKTGHLELYTHSELLIARGSSLDLVTQAQMRNPYLALHEDLLRGAYATYCVELLDRFTVEEDVRHDALFTLLDATFERLCYDPDVLRVVRYYELRLLDEVAFALNSTSASPHKSRSYRRINTSATRKGVSSRRRGQPTCRISWRCP